MHETINSILARLLGRPQLDPERVGMHEYYRRLDGLSYGQIQQFGRWLAERGRMPRINSLEDYLEERRKLAGHILPARPLAGVGYRCYARGATFGRRRWAAAA